MESGTSNSDSISSKDRTTAGSLPDDGGGVIPGDGDAGAWDDLTGRPAILLAMAALANAIGFLKNDGAGNLTWEDADGTMTAEEIRDALETLAGAARLSYTAIKDTPAAYSLPIATDIVLGGVKVTPGSGLQIDSLTGQISVVVSLVGAMIIVSWLAFDTFNTYTSGTVSPNLTHGISWIGGWGNVTGPAMDTDRYPSDNFNAYPSGTVAPNGGTAQWIGAWGAVVQ